MSDPGLHDPVINVDRFRHLRTLDPLYGTVRLVDASRPQHDGGNAGAGEEAGIGAVRDAADYGAADHFVAGGRGPLHHDRDGTYNYTVCDRSFTPPKCSALFHSQIQTMEPKGGHAEGWDPVSGNWTKLAPPDGVCTAKSCDCGRVPCGFYLFDHRQGETKVKGQTLREWFVENMFITPTGLESPAVDGFFVDDMWPKPNPNRSWPPPPSRGRGIGWVSACDWRDRPLYAAPGSNTPATA